MASLTKSTALTWCIRLMLIISGGIIAAPGIIGALSASGLATLYTIPTPVGTEAVLLQHRGILLVIVGGLLFLGSFVAHLRLAAIIAGLVSNVVFILLTYLYPTSYTGLAKIAWVDMALTVLLVIALIIHIRRKV